METAVEKSESRIAQLDGWRGVSILFVVVGHLVNQYYNDTHDTGHVDIIDGGFARVLSLWGVNIFFVISGFIITKLALREHDRNGCFSVRDFYTRRFFRIIPPFFLYLGAVVVAGAFSLIDQRTSDVLPAAAFVCNFPVMECGWFVGHSWTLAYEEQFYITFPLLFALTGTYMRQAIPLLFVGLVAFPFIRFFLHMSEAWHDVANFAPAFSIICAGAVMAACEEPIKRLAQSRYAIYISCAAVLALGGLLVFNADATIAVGSLSHNIRAALNKTVMVGGIAWLVVSSVYQTNLLTRMLTAPPLLFLGMISYSLYLWQQLFTAPYARYLSDGMPHLFPLMFVAATLSYYVVERPSVRLGKRLLDRWARTAPRTLAAARDPLPASIAAVQDR